MECRVAADAPAANPMAEYGILVGEKNLRIGALAAMVHVSDIAVCTMEVGLAGDNPIPAIELYAKRSSLKGPEEMVYQKQLLIEWVGAAPGGNN